MKLAMYWKGGITIFTPHLRGGVPRRGGVVTRVAAPMNVVIPELQRASMRRVIS